MFAPHVRVPEIVTEAGCPAAADGKLRQAPAEWAALAITAHGAGHCLAPCRAGESTRLPGIHHDRRADARDHQATERAAHHDLRAQPRDQRLADLITAADARDRAAGIRDHAADDREAAARARAEQGRSDNRLDQQDRDRAGIDRLWAASDRDAAASDRADFLDALKAARVEPDNT